MSNTFLIHSEYMLNIFIVFYQSVMDRHDFLTNSDGNSDGNLGAELPALPPTPQKLAKAPSPRPRRPHVPKRKNVNTF